MKIYDNLKKFGNTPHIRFYMPGHKGKNVDDDFLSAVLPYDVTELHKTDNLFSPEGVIKTSQEYISEYFGVTSAHYLTGGATLGLYGALGMCKGKSGRVLIDRSCHKSILDALILLDMVPVFLPYHHTEKGLIAPVSAEDVFTALKLLDFDAVVLTSPSYYGLCADIAVIHEITKEFGVPLIVDAAHGGNMLFSGTLPLCAEYTVVSLHKTLPAMTGAAVLFSNGANADDITNMLSLFSTSSPSHVILASAEKSILYMMEKGIKRLPALSETCAVFNAFLDLSTPFSHIEARGSDSTRIVIHTGNTDMSGFELYDILENEYGIICEMADDFNVVLIPTVLNDGDDFRALVSAITEISARTHKADTSYDEEVLIPQQILRIREAFFSEKEKVSIDDACGRVCGEMVFRYPPGIPYLIPGQKIGKKEVMLLSRLNIKEISVIKWYLTPFTETKN